MSKHADAVGYLKDLSTEINLSWLTMICDMSILDSKKQLSPSDLDYLKMMYTGMASYLAPKNSPTNMAPATTAVVNDFLEAISDFDNFKRIEPTFSLKFDKQTTIIFGHNGSGKSSICDAFKILANHDSPTRPIKNVRVMGNQNTKFSYKFKSRTQPTTWLDNSGYGSQHHLIKYFDSGVAAKSVRENINPGKIVELSPFNMHIFDSTKEKIGKFRDALQEINAQINTDLDSALASTRDNFKEYPNKYLSSINSNKLDQLDEIIKKAEATFDVETLAQAQIRFSELEKASSEEGQKILTSEVRDINEVVKTLKEILGYYTEIEKIDPKAIISSLQQKTKEHQEINSELAPAVGKFENFLNFIIQAKEFCDFESDAGQTCPLCKRLNGNDQSILFKKYSNMLSSQLEKDILSLRKSEGAANSIFESISKINLDKISTLEMIPQEKRNVLIALVIDLKKSMNSKFELSESYKKSIDFAKNEISKLEIEIKEKNDSLEISKKGASEIKKEKDALANKISDLKYDLLSKTNLDNLKKIKSLHTKKNFWDTHLPKFTNVLKKITESEKAAHEDLVVSDFYKRLENEYKSLAEKDISSFGVALTKKGSSTGVSVLAKVGSSDISTVLSEGEQRLHSIALFFAELETCKHSVIVFDDPISSFDYDYITNYCLRLRDFKTKHPERQIIVLTHNWEFFVNLQTVLNGQQLQHKFSVQVIEGCSVASNYSENIPDLKSEITSVLSRANEPSRADKEITAGRMRRLIEAIVNTHIFHGQRHQYKQKSSTVSDFQKYTKVKPLTPQEATDLKDLYGKLSIREHDDPRNAYVNTDKAMFQTRFDKIVAIEAAIEART